MSKPLARGGIYVLVLASSGIAMSLGLTGLAALSWRREIQAINADREQAALLAESALHAAMQVIDGNDNWRTIPGGAVYGPVTLGGATLSVVASDPIDNDLDDDATDPYTLTARAQLGTARQRLAVEVCIGETPIESMYATIVSTQGATGDGRLCVYPYELPYPICSSSFPLFRIPVLFGAAALNWIDQPAPSVIDDYVALATPIPLSASNGSKGKTYDGLTLSADRAPAGVTPNPRGVYHIDGRGNDVTVTGASIVGTLIVTNAPTVTVRSPTVLRTGAEGLPILLIRGDAVLTDVGNEIIDATAPDTDDAADGPDFDDPTFDGMQGIIYVDGDISIPGDFDLRGPLISSGLITIQGNAVIRHNPAFVEAPPPGFSVSSGACLFAPGSWREVVD